jgi:hypothetical protein
MEPHPEPERPDLAYLLPRDAYYHLIRTLRAALPAPVTDTPEDRACRDNAAIAQVASLLPANAAESSLAAQYVAANAQAMESLRLAQDPDMALRFVVKCRAQAIGSMRLSHAAMRLLLRIQAARQKTEADCVATDRAAWTEHCAAGLMAQALPGAPPAAMPEPPPPRMPPPPVPQADPIAEAEQYAVIYPQRAALIRRLGRVPDNVTFGPPEEHLVRALVTGRSPVLLALDRQSTAIHAS